MNRRPRIGVVTPLFPIREEPYRGNFIYQTVVELQRWADIKVFCPLAVYPRQRWLQPVSYKYHEPDLDYSPPKVSTSYFTYPTLPVIGRMSNGFLSGSRLLPLLRSYEPDLVLAYWIYPEGYGAVRAARKLRVPVVVGSRGSDLRRPKDAFSRRLIRTTLVEAGVVLSVSDELHQHAIALGAPADRIVTVHNGCDRSIFKPANRSQARTALGIDPHSKLILFVGHLLAAKGVNELCDAVRELAASHPTLKLVYIGEGAVRRDLETRAADLISAGHIHFAGACPAVRVAEWMAASDMVCLPSYSEGCPNVVIEALCCGRPVVASHVGGIPELIKPECGILMPPRDSRALAAALDQALRRDWDEAGIARHFQRGWDDAARETFEACSRLLPG